MSGSDEEDRERLPADRTYRQYHRDQERSTIQALFERLGYNLWNQADVNRLRENLEFSQKARLREESFKSRRIGWAVSFAIAIISAVVTTMGEWFANKFGK